jgi:hypothetical protein
LPDVVFANQKYQFWYILGDVVMKNVGLFSGNFVPFMSIWYIHVCFVGIGYIFTILVYCTKKNLATLEPILRLLNLQLQRLRCKFYKAGVVNRSRRIESMRNFLYRSGLPGSNDAGFEALGFPFPEGPEQRKRADIGTPRAGLSEKLSSPLFEKFDSIRFVRKVFIAFVQKN